MDGHVTSCNIDDLNLKMMDFKLHIVLANLENYEYFVRGTFKLGYVTAHRTDQLCKSTSAKFFHDVFEKVEAGLKVKTERRKRRMV